MNLKDTGFIARPEQTTPWELLKLIGKVRYNKWKWTKKILGSLPSQGKLKKKVLQTWGSVVVKQ